MVIDADALHASLEDGALASATPRRVLTPHAGEFAAAFPTIDLADREAAAARAAERTGAVVVLKGSETVVAAPDGRRIRNRPASPFLASAGTGDVLSGLIVGLLAQGMPTFDAACAAVWLHAACADATGPGLIAEDLADRAAGPTCVALRRQFRNALRTGGWGGIRTHEAVSRLPVFQDRCLRPLGHPSGIGPYAACARGRQGRWSVNAASTLPIDLHAMCSIRFTMIRQTWSQDRPRRPSARTDIAPCVFERSSSPP